MVWRGRKAAKNQNMSFFLQWGEGGGTSSPPPPTTFFLPTAKAICAECRSWSRTAPGLEPWLSHSFTVHLVGPSAVLGTVSSAIKADADTAVQPAPPERCIIRSRWTQDSNSLWVTCDSCMESEVLWVRWAKGVWAQTPGTGCPAHVRPQEICASHYLAPC